MHEYAYTIDISAKFKNSNDNGIAKGTSVIRSIVKTFQLILPVLIPSWRFFDSIAPSPRIEFTVFDAAGNTCQDWQEFWPRPARVGIVRMLRRIFWNPCWNDSLYVVACAERLIKLQDEGTQKHSVEQIAKRIRNHLSDDKMGKSFKFRLIFMNRHENKVVRHQLYISDLFQGTAP
ncbi:hypothetical protein [Lentilitoribacter sp. EG35]|uniref:hypothetical protein n=1 Tax=Lentilitoribacter sp. EG35 TaxID=3234192 RepID=UPI0034615CD5